jgi:hypothetical protein
MAEGELERIKEIYLNRQKYSQPRNLKKKPANPLKISEAHSSGNALKYVLFLYLFVLILIQFF